jgi:hypothetical protein
LATSRAIPAREEARTSIGLVKQHRFAIYKWVFGIIAGIIVGYILATIQK